MCGPHAPSLAIPATIHGTQAGVEVTRALPAASDHPRPRRPHRRLYLLLAPRRRLRRRLGRLRGAFLFTYWIGLGFVITWEVVRHSLHSEKASPRTVALTGLAVVVFMLMMLGGPAVLFDDPWLFGVAIAPGIELAMPWLQGGSVAEEPLKTGGCTSTTASR